MPVALLRDLCWEESRRSFFLLYFATVREKCM